MTRYVELAAEERLAPAYAALIDAARHVGDRQVRNRGTIGGSVCWNYIAACMPAVALTLDATMNLVSGSGGQRSLPAREFIGAPLETARRDDELLVSLQLPAPPKNAGSAYRKWSLLSDGLPVIGACVYVETDGSGKCAKARVGFGGLASGPKRSPAAEASSSGAVPTMPTSSPGHGGGGRAARDPGRPLGRSGLPLESDPHARHRDGRDRSASRHRSSQSNPSLRRHSVSTRTVRITINGEVFEETVPIRMPLTDFIRDRAGLTGTHVGCTYEGVCGACTVQLDGQAVKSCLMLAVQADGHAVATVEGLAQNGALSPLQKSFNEHHALQCGYCTPGILMNMAEFIDKHPNPTDEEIRHALIGNLCRCTGYVHIVDAVREASKRAAGT